MRLPIEPKLLSFVLVDLRAGRPVLDKASDIDRAAFTAEGGEPSIGAYMNFKSTGLLARERGKRIQPLPSCRLLVHIEGEFGRMPRLPIGDLDIDPRDDFTSTIEAR